MFVLQELVLTSKLFWFTILITILYLYLKYIVFGYWKRKGIPYEEPTLIVGNLLPFIRGKSPLGQTVAKNYEKFCNYPFHGIYMFIKPVLMINDPELIRSVLIKEFQKFRDRTYGVDETVNPLIAHLFFLGGEKWKRIRTKLTPAFTSGKLKLMFPLMKNVGDELASVVDDTLKTNNVIEIKDLIARYTTDTIACLVFGLEPESLKNPNSEFRKHQRLIFQINKLKRAMLLFAPSLLNFFQISILSKEVFNFFTSTFINTINYRKKEKIVKNDFLNLLMELLDDEESESKTTDKLTMMEACAQAFVFFFAGYETSSSTVTFCLYELASNPHIQDKLKKEIDEFLTKPDGFSYSNVMSEMKYLDMVFYETLRKHPSAPFLTRICDEEWTIPDSNFTVPKGMMVQISASGIHRNPEFYPEPDKFDPERFTKENINSRSPFTFLGFGDGPRICIGNRFGIMQSKVALVSLLSKYKFSLCEQTSTSIQYALKTVIQTPRDSVLLKIEPI